MIRVLLPWLVVLVLLSVGCSVTAAADGRLQYIDFTAGRWTALNKGAYEGRLDRRQLFVIEHPYIQSVTGNYGSIETSACVPRDWTAPYALHFFAQDNYIDTLGEAIWTGIDCYSGHRFKQILIDGKVVWEIDVGDHHTSNFAVDITPCVKPGKPFLLALRVMDKVGTDVRLAGDFAHLRPPKTDKEKKEREGPRNFHTCVWWGDVAIREKDDASDPLPPRPRPVEKRIKIHPKSDYPLRPLGLPYQEPIRISLQGHTLLPQMGYPVTSGVPLPYGKVRDVSRIGLLNSRGRPVITQCKVLNKWTDGSVRWVLLDFVAQRGEAAYRLILNREPSHHATQSAKVSRQGGGTSIETDSLTISLGGDAENLIDSIRLHGEKEPAAENVRTHLTADIEGRPVECSLERSRVRVTDTGPVKVGADVQGIVLAQGRRLGRFVLRLSAFSGKHLVKISYRLFNDSGTALKIRNFGLSFTSELPSESEVWWGTENSQFIGKVQPDFQLQQKTASQWVCSDTANSAMARADGYFRVTNGHTSIMVAVPDFWQQFPKALSVRDNQVTIDLFSATEEIPFYRMTDGEAKRHDILLDFSRPDTELEEERLKHCLLNPPRLFSNEWFCASGGFGPTYHYLDPQFKKLRDHMAYLQSTEKEPVYYGIRDFGDRRYNAGEDKWCNNYYDMLLGMLAEYIASGNRFWFDKAESTARHVMDIDQCHHDATDPTNVGGVYGLYTPNHNESPGGFWEPTFRVAAGLATYYRLTGEPDAREALIMLADMIVRKDSCIVGQGPGTSSRNYGGVLSALVWALDETNDRKYERAFRRILQDLLAGGQGQRQGEGYIDQRRGAFCERHNDYAHLRGSIPWLTAQLVEPLYLYYRYSGDPDAARAVVGMCESTICENMTPNSPGDFTGYSFHPRFLKVTGYNTLLATMMMYAYDLTGDAEFLKCARGAFDRTVKEGTVGNIMNTHWSMPTLLYFLHRHRNE